MSVAEFGLKSPKSVGECCIANVTFTNFSFTLCIFHYFLPQSNWKENVTVGVGVSLAQMLLYMFLFKINLPCLLRAIRSLVHSSCLTCSPASRASHVLVAHVPRVLHALVPHVHHALRALMPHAPHALRVFVCHLSCTIDTLCVPHFKCLIPNILMHLMSHSSCVFHLFWFWYFRYLSFFLTWTTVNHYVMRLLLKKSYYSGSFLTWYKPPGSLNLCWPHHINPSTHICQESNMTCLLNATSIHYILTMPTQIH